VDNSLDRITSKEKQLEEILRTYNNAAVAFSGGVDSTYVLHKAAQVLGKKNILAVTVHSELHPVAEVDEAEKLARGMGLPHLVVTLDLLTDPGIKNNVYERCYICKKRIFSKLQDLAVARGFAVIIDGTNADDPNDDRPGLRALKELGIRSPLMEAGLTKEEIRALSLRNELPTGNKPSAACLATRFPHGETLTAIALTRVAEAEAYIRSLGVNGNLRVRFHGGKLARIEVDPEEFALILAYREELYKKLSRSGFDYITIDLKGFRSGSMNK